MGTCPALSHISSTAGDPQAGAIIDILIWYRLSLRDSWLITEGALRGVHKGARSTKIYGAVLAKSGLRFQVHPTTEARKLKESGRRLPGDTGAGRFRKVPPFDFLPNETIGRREHVPQSA
jgi:hypothetical protein